MNGVGIVIIVVLRITAWIIEGVARLTFGLARWIFRLLRKIYSGVIKSLLIKQSKETR